MQEHEASVWITHFQSRPTPSTLGNRRSCVVQGGTPGSWRNPWCRLHRGQQVKARGSCFPHSWQLVPIADPLQCLLGSLQQVCGPETLETLHLQCKRELVKLGGSELALSLCDI